MQSDALQSNLIFGVSGTRNTPAASAPEIRRLTKELAAGNEAAFKEFHAAYFNPLYRFLIVVCHGCEAEAQEALQETLLRVVRYAKAFNDAEIFWCWLKSLARTAARDRQRKQGRYAALLEKFSLHRAEIPTEKPVKENRLSQLISETLSEFPTEDRQILEAKYMDGESVKDIAAVYNLTEKTIESRLARLRERLRERVLRKLKNS